MNSVDLAFTPALEQARLIRSREISPLELVELYLERIERLNPLLGSYFTVMSETAIATAKAQTDQLTQADPVELPPFFGVPISIKDLTPVAGVCCSYGLKVAKNRVAKEDAGVVTRLRQAGFILLGKTAASEIGSTPFTEPRGFPPARNPWNLDYTPGGSSGGAAASVAAGLAAIAQGTDGGGSIRGPAFCCGLVGIKPSRGRVSMAPVGDRLNGLPTDGPIARTVADAAALLDVMAGYVVGDPYWLPDPNPSFLAATERPPGLLKIGFTTDFSPLGCADAACTQAVMDTAKRLEAMGHTVEPVRLNLDDLIEPLIAVWQTGVDVGVPWFVMGKLNRWLYWRSRKRSAGQFLTAVNQMQIASRRIVATLIDYDATIFPVFLHPTIRVGEWARLPARQMFQNIVHWVAPSPILNATGQPGIALPTGFTEQGLPLGIQLVGRPAGEETLISIAAQLEQDQPWSQHRPAIATAHPRS
ncbi:MAG: amidase [Cyanobacteria bacterium J069]|nr:MAG: amidase [Cyanobacteria bacterium J069]